MKDDIVCGLHAVLAALKRNPRQIDVIWLSADRADRRDPRAGACTTPGGSDRGCSARPTAAGGSAGRSCR
ncbi:MAG: RNA methyltransferase substrate-binding domain-containing protein, partial [Acidiferrobacterales bacterium]